MKMCFLIKNKRIMAIGCAGQKEYHVGELDSIMNYN